MDLVFDFLNDKIKLNRLDSIVVGVSAGPDSMCLLYILMELRKKIGFQLIVAHINHNKREESIEEEQFLKEYCQDHEVIFESMKIENYKSDNFHKVAREIRYDFYKKILEKYNAGYLMTAHHGDDLIETILMRLVRGSTLNGYHGISLITNRETYLIVRPLLFLTKEEIKKFDDSNKIPYRMDKSNFSDKYTRNRYRKYVLPFLKEENPLVHLKFLKFSTLMEESSEYIEKEVNIAYNNAYKDRSLDILLFLSYDKFIQKQILERIFLDLYDDLSNISNKHIEILLKLIYKRKTGSQVYLPHSFLAVLDYSQLKFQKISQCNDEYCLELKDGLVLPNGMKFIEYAGLENGNDTIHLLSLDVSLPLYVRNKRSGDRIELKGTLGRKKISDIFIDEKISKLERDHYPVVVDSKGIIVWVPKLKKSKYDSQNDKKCDIIFKCL